MARPEISGIGEGERLCVVWPGAGWDSNGPREHRAEVLPLIAMLHPEPMVTALMAEITNAANVPLPATARKQRIAELKGEIEALQRIALALGVETSDVTPAVWLGVRLLRQRVERRTRAA
jgi:hypothetical protein